MSSPASLDVVEDTVRREFDAQERRADAADTRAGLILGFAGLVVSLGGDGWPPLALAARFLAGVAGLIALRALSVPAFHGVNVQALSKHVTADPLRTRLVLLKSAVAAHDELDARLDVKLARVRRASLLLMAALVFVVLAVSVDAVS